MDIRFDGEYADAAEVVLAETKVCAEQIAALCDVVVNAESYLASAAAWAVIYEMVAKCDVSLRAMLSVAAKTGNDTQLLGDQFTRLVAVAREVAAIGG